MVININVNCYVYDTSTSIHSQYYFTNDLMNVLMVFTKPAVHWKAGFTSINVTIFHLKATDVSLHHSSAQTMSQAMSVNSSGFATALMAVRELSPCVRLNVCVRNPALYCSAHPWGYRIGSRWTCHTRRPAPEDLASLECPASRIYPLFPEDPEYQCHHCREDPGSLLLLLRECTIWQLHKIRSQMLHRHFLYIFITNHWQNRY